MLPRNIGYYTVVQTTKPAASITSVMLHEVVDDETHRLILEKWDGPVVSFGGGVQGISVADLIESVSDNPRTMARKFGITIKQSREIIDRAKEISKRENR